MSNTVIKVENVSKQYRLGQIGTGTLAHDMNRFWYKLRGKEDPYLKIGDVNNRTEKAAGNYIWALRDINFDVKRGEVLGIIGRNGAGKSTLLKILSRTTSPTTGAVKIKGRVASLLEVGTGFHPELTGRENIFLNGAILGMRKKEIEQKFDEIVAFAAIEKYVDTPVKRYSSGMYVRLAFAVAAHLEPEILIVDEVLAVGDAEFQKKCLGKMKDVSTNEGRTILFVSHNMTAITSLCNKGLILSNGGISSIGNIREIANKYQLLFSPASKKIYAEEDNNAGNAMIRIVSIEMESNNEQGGFFINQDQIIKIEFINMNIFTPLNINLFFNAPDGTNIFATCSMSKIFKTGKNVLKCFVPANFMNDNIYSLNIMAVTDDKAILHITEALVIEGFEQPRNAGWLGKFPGYIRPLFKWSEVN